MGSTSGRPPLRLAILEADKPQPKANARYDGYGGVFADLFGRALAPEPLGAHLHLTAYDVVGGADGPSAAAASYPDLSSVDAVLITGSKHCAYRDDPWLLRLVDFTRGALATAGRVKLVGICFGHQVIARALGARVGRNDRGWELSVTEVGLSEAGRLVFGSDKLRIYQMHRDIVFSNPKGALNLGENKLCATQGFLLPGRAMTVQGHPEFTQDIVREILALRRDTNVLTNDEYESGMTRVKNKHDGVRIAQAFLRFLRGEDDLPAE